MSILGKSMLAAPVIGATGFAVMHGALPMSDAGSPAFHKGSANAYRARVMNAATGPGTTGDIQYNSTTSLASTDQATSSAAMLEEDGASEATAAQAITAIANASSVTTQVMPREVDASNQAGWWVPATQLGNDTYFAFNFPGNSPNTHFTKIGKRDVSGNWTFGIMKQRDGSVLEHTDDLGHDQPTIAVDGKGYIHVFADMHNNDWEYYRSDYANNATKIRRSSLMPGNGAFTYPVAKTDADGNIWLIIRNRAGSDGNGELYRWSNSGRTWSRVAVFASANDAVVYPDDIAIAPDGSVNILFEWAKSEPRTLRHYGSYLRYYPSTGRWYFADGTQTSVPVDLSNQKLFYLPLQAGESFTTNQDAIGLQSAKLAINPGDNQPTIVYRFRNQAAPSPGTKKRDFDVWRVRYAGGWVDREMVYDADDDTFAALGVTRSATTVRVYYATTSGAKRAVKTAGAPWAIASLPQASHVQRLGVVSLNATTDILYGSAPTEINADKGRVYWQRIED